MERGLKPETLLRMAGICLLAALIILTLQSDDWCTKAVLSAAWFFAALWLLFGLEFLEEVDLLGVKLTLPVSVVLLALWIVLKLTNVCGIIVELWNSLVRYGIA